MSMFFSNMNPIFSSLNTMEIDLSGTRSGVEGIHDLYTFAGGSLTSGWLSKLVAVTNITVIKMYLR